MDTRVLNVAAWTLSILAVTELPLCEAGSKGRSAVPPADEILVISPTVDPEGKPRPIFQSDSTTGMQRVEIPPTVIVHRYYYTGDRDFQGPMLPGGPSVIVASHPVTGEQLMIQAQLLPGAPRVHYTHRSIQYDYGKTKIILDFGFFKKSSPHVVVKQCSHSTSESIQVTAKTTSNGLGLGLGDLVRSLGQSNKPANQGSVSGITSEFENTIPTVR